MRTAWSDGMRPARVLGCVVLAATLGGCRGAEPLAAGPGPSATHEAPPTGTPTYKPLNETESPEALLQNRHEDWEQVLEVLDLAPGMKVADVGCGAGYFTPHLARAVGPGGRVEALDLNAAFVAVLQERLARDPSLDPHGVVHAYVNPASDTLLAAGSMDLVFLAHLDFYLYDPLPDTEARFLDSVAAAVAPGGRLVVVQWMGLLSGYTDARGVRRHGRLQDMVAHFQRRGLTWEKDLQGRIPLHPVERTAPNLPAPKKDQYQTRIEVFRRPPQGGGSP